jgi:methyl-accepting chemotaxis protein
MAVDSSYAEMRIVDKLKVALAIMLIVMIAGLGTIAYLMNNLNHYMSSALDFTNLRRSVNTMRAELYWMLLNDSPDVRRDSKAKAESAAADCIEKTLPNLTKSFADDKNIGPQVTELSKSLKQYVQTQNEDLIPAIQAGRSDDAKTIIFGAQGQALTKILSKSSELGQEAVNISESQINTSNMASVAVLIVALGVAAIAYASSVKSLGSASKELSSAVDVLGRGVEQILSSVTDSAAGTTETATAVNETTTTVEELKQTSQLSSDKAKSVYESAQRAEEISAAGRNATEQTVDGMKRIRKQMDQIAESMGHLSEKARNIVEIIATVDDLAKQSNLLAVNAAIEAAKAGDQGKGFAVVAQQVKSMSDQSKQATAQVRAILDEIQSAANSAGKATELGSQAVDAVMRQSSQAGDSITILASSVSESATAAAQIAQASKQQVTGVDQVVTAMLGIKEAATQNVSAISRVEDAANKISEAGDRLREIARRY